MPDRRLILSIDQGTTNTKAVLVDARGSVVARASRPVGISFPQPGWVEQDADDIWRTVEEAVGECLASARAADVAALALTNQRESALVWDRRSGRPLGPVITWQCRRTAAFCDDLRDRGVSGEVAEATGLTLDPLFSASKMRWLLERIPDGRARAEAGELAAGTVDSWLIWNFTSGAVHATDVTNASRTSLLDLATGQWSPRMLEIFGIPRPMLPVVMHSTGVISHTTGRGGLVRDVPIGAAIGDSHAALFGQAAFRPGRVKATYGTGSSLMTLVAEPVRSRTGLSTTVAWSDASGIRYALEGNVTDTGGAVDWVARLLGCPGPAAVADLAASVPDAGAVVLVPAFAGLGAPHWDADARGLLTGLSRGTTAAHVARAAIESIAFQVRDVFEAMSLDAGRPTQLFADGGASRNATLMQFQADILDCPVVRNDAADLSAQGAAWLAGLAVGVWSSLDDLDALPRTLTRFEPAMAAAERDHRIARWREAVQRTRARHGSVG